MSPVFTESEAGVDSTAPVNPRVQRTRNALIDACVESLRETRSESLNISSLVKSASVSRQSFYEHFGSRESILIAAGMQLLGEPAIRYGESMCAGKDDLACAEALMEEVSPHREAIINLLGGPADTTIFGAVRKQLLPLVAQFIDARMDPAATDVSSEHKRWTAEFIIGGMLISLIDSLRKGHSSQTFARRIDSVGMTLDALTFCQA